jgi:hypothetical protein
MEEHPMLFTKMIGHLLLAAVFCLGTISPVWAKVPAEEAERLGKDLTPMGAEKAGNSDGTIPSWEGGLTKAPEGYKGPGTWRVNPFADEKPLFSITAKDMEKYADRLTEGQKAMFKKYPGTFRMDVYPTHRTFAAPQWVYDNTKANATRSELSKDQNSISGAAGGIPFPIPKSGAEAIWNHQLRWQGHATLWEQYTGYLVYPNGKWVHVIGAQGWEKHPYYDRDKTVADVNKGLDYYMVFVLYKDPPRRKGEVVVWRDNTDFVNNPRAAWQYLVGQRRVRRAPTVAYDTPNAGYSGIATYDDTFMFNGALDRYNWKLLKKKEIYVPYNCYKVVDKITPEEFLHAGHLNPDFIRWELHRVWVVEATLKEGQRHIYGKRTFYLDEDSWVAHMVDAYDNRNELWRFMMAPTFNAYEANVGTFQGGLFHFDLNDGSYAANGTLIGANQPRVFNADIEESFFTPEQVRRFGKR